nr:unnamed protein product [Callosobruchus chinensis]
MNLMPEFGNILLLVACLLSLTYLFLPFSSYRFVSSAIFFCVSASMAILIYCHIKNDFSLENVYYHSHTTKPLIYKICGIETDGLGFNPILQDIGLAIHPPILYLGYLGFSVPFSLSIAGLILNTEGNVWAKIVRPWVLISWSLLTSGISLGSWWAYRELGWGGFWFWDPVENVSLMPWLIAVALTHLLLVVRNFNTLRNFAILLTLTTFILSVTGTFLVRSGILTSVHTFADDSRYGLYILALLGVITVSSLVIFVVFTRKNHTSFQYSILESEKKSATQVTFGESILLARRVSKSYYAMMLAHAGVAILVLGIACSVGWQEKKENYLGIGDSITINKFKVTLRNIEFIKEKNFHAVRGTMDIRNLLNSKVIGDVTPEYRFYLAEGQKNVESSIYHNLFSDIYVVIGEIDKSKSKIAAKVHYKPGMSIIWLGSFLIAFGSLLAALPSTKKVVPSVS